MPGGTPRGRWVLSSTPQQIRPKDLFNSCMEREKNVTNVKTKKRIAELRRNIAKVSLFPTPIPDEAADAQDETRELVNDGKLFRVLMKMLRQLDRKRRWILLATILRFENV